MSVRERENLCLIKGVTIMSYDIIGDVHGCYDECLHLLKKLGYDTSKEVPTHPENRTVVFVGDITDRGPNSLKMITLVSNMAHQNVAKYVPGNHCNKLYRFFLGRNVKQTHGLETTVAEYKALSEIEQQAIRRTFMSLYEQAPLYLRLDEDQLIVCHAGIREEWIGRYDKRVETFVFYGDITGEFDEQGNPVRRNWAKQYTGKRTIVYGHTPVLEPYVINNTYNIDTGCVFGGKLTALRYPEKTFVSVPSSMPLVQEKLRTLE